MNSKIEKHSFSETKLKSFNEKHLNDIKNKGTQNEMQQFLNQISPHFVKKPSCKNHWIVVVDVSKNINEISKRLSNWCFVIVGENEQNIDQIETNVFYLTEDIHNKLSKMSPFFKTTYRLSKNNYAARKNAGYLWAILHEATTIWDFHCDNELLIEDNIDFIQLNDTVNALTVPNYHNLLFNPLPFYLKNPQEIWPRGFPLQFINNTSKNISDNETLYGYWPTKNIGIIQSLSQYHPDIDLINGVIKQDSSQIHLKRLSEDPKKDIKLIVPRRTFSPYNEQATLHYYSALWTLLLPITIKHHLSDIWRSYAMQRLMWDVGLQIAFAGPYVIKKQSIKSEEFQSAKDSYLKIDKFVEFLNNWSSNHTNIMKRAEQLYMDMYEKSYIEIDDVHLIQLWFKELSQYNYIFPNIPPKYTLAVRTFSGHLSRLNHRLIPTVNMFVDRNVFDFMVILDDESREDHLLGECLKKYNISVKYEALPEFRKRGIQLKGYDRQQWSTFYMDRFSDSDYIGVIDADALIFSFMHPFYSIFTSEDDKRIMLRAMVGDAYPNDKVALGFHLDLNFMWPNCMPMWYRWETYQNLRNHISFTWNGTSFDDAYLGFAGGGGYSQFTIISTYATRFEANYYRVIMNNDSFGSISVANNRGRDFDIVIGCCRSFNIGCNHTQMPSTYEDHLFRYDNTDIAVVNATQKINSYYEHIDVYVKQMPPETVIHMKQSCQKLLDGILIPICVS